jgi:C4-dicarboxylate-specific signal transduction histidine kinase|tara:strand:- start:65 stop:1648 length:1584 start_codon:yes stop_codon:yes gene_type:complete
MAMALFKKTSLPIAWRIAISIVIASIMINAISSSALIYINYKEEEKQFVNRVAEIQTSHMTSLANALWHFDNIQIKVQGEGIQNLYFIGYVRISSDNNTLYESGEVSSNPQEDHFMMPVEQAGRVIGELEVGFARDSILKDIIYTAQKMILMQLAAGLLLALILLWRVHRIITRHLIDLHKQLSRKKESSDHQFLTLDRANYHDELSAVVSSFNQLTEEINDELSKKEAAQKALAETNNQLEQRVEERTQNLQEAIDKLNNTLENLRNTQSQLIESEKLSSLGGMVAGVAHEINTPIGLCITTHSFIKDLFDDMKKRFDSGSISKNNFTEFMSNMEESVDILSKNLERAAKLVKSFKHVSEDQAGEALRKYNLNEYLYEIHSTLHPKLKTTRHKVTIICPKSIELEGYPGALSQVITNLVMNSLLHGFENIEQGSITIEAEQEDDHVVIVYSDNGSGLSLESQTKIFEPFYTTKRGYGGTGLGMHLVYNLVCQTMQGTIQLKPVSQGCAFIMTIPYKIKDTKQASDT